jgi:hypothetical protein
VIRVEISQTDADSMDDMFRLTTDRKLRDRLQIVLMAHRGRPRQDIAADLGVNRRTVTRWVNAYCDAGLDGLRPKRVKRIPGKIPASLADEVQGWVIDGPAGVGLTARSRPPFP